MSAKARGGRHSDIAACTLTLELASPWTLCGACAAWPLVIPLAEMRCGDLGRCGVHLLEISQQPIEKEFVMCFPHH